MNERVTGRGEYRQLAERLLDSPVRLAVYAVFLLALPRVFPIGLATQIAIFGLFALAFNLLFGYSGLLSFGHALFLGTGAYAAALVVIHFDGPPVAAILLAVVVLEGAIALVAGLLSLRLSGVYFSMITLAFGQFFYELSYTMDGLTGGSDGLLGVYRPSLFGAGLVELSDADNFYTLVAALTFLVLLFGFLMTRSTFGRTLRAIRENEERTRALGVNTYRVKVLIFAISGMLAGVAGALQGLYLRFVSPDVLFWAVSGDAVLNTLVGGMQTLFGPIVGALFLHWLEDTFFGTAPGAWNVLLGAVFVFFVLFARSGIVGVFRTALRRVADRLDRGGGGGDDVALSSTTESDD
ncbi:branched-chain amino acid ABC transporter permease [Haloglomus litoreum]|uniref:branched-chain amino acid ABC transporter permease n=1 Tax=Haloglomus litoreum TaxID=3034026 RepID=UPI0023E841DB|nr:branched-chain amino acid ABC transporter permease [Haloglomus sp. DT116]